MDYALFSRMLYIPLHFYTKMRSVMANIFSLGNLISTKLSNQQTSLPLNFVFQANSGSTAAYSLLAVTISGFAYLCNLRRPSSYSPGSTLPANDMLEISIKSNAQHGEITALTATPGCLVIGRQDGSISCYQLGKLDPNSPGPLFIIQYFFSLFFSCFKFFFFYYLFIIVTSFLQ